MVVEQARPQSSSPATSGFRASHAATGRFGVLLSYARSDGEAFANEIRKRLNQNLPSLPVWQDRPEIEGGVGGWRQIETALERVECLVSVITPAVLASEVTARA
jgi:hypothetical protein